MTQTRKPFPEDQQTGSQERRDTTRQDDAKNRPQNMEEVPEEISGNVPGENSKRR